MSLTQVEAIAQAHLSCQYPSKECDPVEAALAAHLNDRETTLLIRAIEGYHNPLTRVLVHAAEQTCRGEDR